MLQIAAGWELHVDHSSEWLFVRLERTESDVEPTTPLAESLWEIAQGRDVRRIVIELGHAAPLTSYLIGQLVRLHKRVHLNGGVVRLAGWSPENHRVLQQMQLGDRFPNYASREDAVMGRFPRKPR